MRPLREVLKSVDRRLAIALGCYAVFAVIAAVFLDGMLRLLMWCFFAILALKTLHAPRMDE